MIDAIRKLAKPNNTGVTASAIINNNDKMLIIENTSFFNMITPLLIDILMVTTFSQPRNHDLHAAVIVAIMR